MSEIITREEAQVTPPAITLPSTTDLSPWQAQPGEPANWYNRFAQFYLNQPGIKRTLSKAYRDYRISEDSTLNIEDVPISGTWYDAYDRYKWNERALMYDQHLINTWLDYNGQALLTHKAKKLHYWTQIIENCSRELAGRNVGGMTENVLTRTIKTINAELNAELPQQPETHYHLHAIHPDLQRLIRDAIESRE